MKNLWDLTDEPEKAPRVALSLPGIVKAAIAIADAEGVEAVSMQRVAADLGFTKMSLYRHVPGKAELLGLMIDTAVGTPPDLSQVPGGWRGKLENFVPRLAQVWQDHPWIPAMTMGARLMGPRETGWVESAVAATAGTPLTGDERLAAAFLIFGHVRTTHATATAGTQPWSGGSEQVELIRSRADLFPELAMALTEPAPTLRDNARQFGLARILDGLAALIAERS